MDVAGFVSVDQVEHSIQVRLGSRPGSAGEPRAIVIEVGTNKYRVFVQGQFGDVVEKSSPIVALEQIELDIRGVECADRRGVLLEIARNRTESAVTRKITHDRNHTVFCFEI